MVLQILVFNLESAGRVMGKEVSNMYWVTGILGLLLVFAPFLVDYSQNPAALFISLSAGALVIAVSALEALRHESERWEYWVALILGVGVLLSPFVFGFGAHFEAVWSTFILGALIAISAGAILYINSYRR